MRSLPYLRLLGAQAAIGAAAIFARYALTGAGPLAVADLRLVIAALPFVAVALTRRRPPIGVRREVALGIAGIALATHFATWIASLLFTGVAISTLLVTTTPLWTMLYDLGATRRAPSRAFALALLMALGGTAAIALAHATPAPVAGHALLGDALALAGALAMALYLILVQRAGVTPARGAALGTPAIVARTYTWAAFALLPLAFAAHQTPPPLAAGVAWLGILGMALVSQALGHTALNAALRDFPPSTVAMTTLAEPIAAAVLAALLFHEALGPQTIAGGLAVLAAVGISLRESRG